MGKLITWELAEDLTGEEIDAVRATVIGRIMPAMPVISAEINRNRPVPTKPISRLMARRMSKYLDCYASDDDLVNVTSEGILIRSMSGDGDFVIPFSAGRRSDVTLSFQDYPVFGCLAAVGSITGRLRLLGGHDVQPERILSVLRRIEKAGGVVFAHLDPMLADYAPETNGNGDGETRGFGP